VVYPTRGRRLAVHYFPPPRAWFLRAGNGGQMCFYSCGQGKTFISHRSELSPSCWKIEGFSSLFKGSGFLPLPVPERPIPQLKLKRLLHPFCEVLVLWGSGSPFPTFSRLVSPPPVPRASTVWSRDCAAVSPTLFSVSHSPPLNLMSG